MVGFVSATGPRARARATHTDTCNNAEEERRDKKDIRRVTLVKEKDMKKEKDLVPRARALVVGVKEEKRGRCSNTAGDAKINPFYSSPPRSAEYIRRSMPPHED